MARSIPMGMRSRQGTRSSHCAMWRLAWLGSCPPCTPLERFRPRHSTIQRGKYRTPSHRSLTGTCQHRRRRSCSARLPLKTSQEHMRVDPWIEQGSSSPLGTNCKLTHPHCPDTCLRHSPSTRLLHPPNSCPARKACGSHCLRHTQSQLGMTSSRPATWRRASRGSCPLRRGASCSHPPGSSCRWGR